MKKLLSPTTNLYLIGPMGAGKSSIGMKLAELSKRVFFDSDTEIEKRCGVSISWIFEKEQEQGFRQREAAVIQELCQQAGIILSTGGGSILNSSNRAMLKKTGLIIYLKISPHEQLARTQLRKSTRPLLQDNASEKLAALNEQRAPLYEEIADLTIITDRQKPVEIAKIIWDQLCKNPS